MSSRQTPIQALPDAIRAIIADMVEEAYLRGWYDRGAAGGFNGKVDEKLGAVQLATDFVEYGLYD